MLHRIRLYVLLVLCSVVFVSVAQDGVVAQEPVLEPCALPIDEIASQGGLTVGALGLTPGALGLTPGALGLTPGALALTPGALALTPGALALTPGALDLPPGLDGITVEQLQALVNEILSNPINEVWLQALLPAVQSGYGYGLKPVAFIIADDFEDVDTEAITHGELVEQIAMDLVTKAGIPNVRTFRVDITDGVNNYVVNDVFDQNNNLVTRGIAGRIADLVQSLYTTGDEFGTLYTRFVLNMSFGLIPCDDVVTVGDVTVPVSVDAYYQQRQEATIPEPITPILECVAANPDGSYTAHLGYRNPNNFPVTIPFSEDNYLAGGALGYADLQARTPFYFGLPFPNSDPDRPDTSAPYPNNAFQVVFGNAPLTWTLQGTTVTADPADVYSRCATVVEPDESYAAEVIAFDQGLRSDGTPVPNTDPNNRSNPLKALGAPENTDTLNFVSLGFGGELVLKFDAPRFANPFGADLRVVETSFGNVSFSQYPEQADVYVAQDLADPIGETNWMYLGTAQLDESFELPEGMYWFQYVRLEDKTHESWPKDRYGQYKMLGDGFDVDGLVACGSACVPDIEPLVECVAYDDTVGTFVAHFGYRNNKGMPVYVPSASGFNELNGMSPFEALPLPPELFGYPAIIEGDPGRTQEYPTSAFQVQFTGGLLIWSILGPDGVLRSAAADASNVNCPTTPQATEFNFVDYLGVDHATSLAIVANLTQKGQTLDDPNLNDLVALLQDYLDASASDAYDFAFIPVASSGNSRPTLGAAPLAPASFSQTIAVSALLGQNPGVLAAFSHDGNIAAPGAWYQFSDYLFGAGTSYAAPFAGAYAASYLTFEDPDACNFTTAAGPGGVPLVGDDPSTFANLAIDVELDCVPPSPPPVGLTCNGLSATIYVQDGKVVGGPRDGRHFTGNLIGTETADVIVGTPGHDVIRGRGSDDVICGMGGHDVIRGDGGHDQIFADEGSEGGEEIESLETAMTGGAATDDVLDGGDDNDLIFAGPGNDIVRGGKGNDALYGGEGHDNINGQFGDDSLYGEGGHDIIRGEHGHDFIDGGAGDDNLHGQEGDYDRIFGGDGNDVIRDDDGFFDAHGGPGSDNIAVTLRRGWRDPNGNALLDGKLSAGYGDDVVRLTLQDRTSFVVNITGDEYDDPASPLEGAYDILRLSGTPVNPASVIIKFELIR